MAPPSPPKAPSSNPGEGTGIVAASDGSGTASLLLPASPGHESDARALAEPLRGGTGGTCVPPSPHSSAASRLAAAAAAETPAAVAASLPRRPPSAGRLAPFTSDPSLPSTLPRKQQSQAQQQTQQQQPQQQAAWGGFSAGATPTAAASASASTSAAALATSTVFGGGIAGGGRSWLKVDAEGRASVVRVDKSHLAAELGVQARDLRLLDPHFNHSYPSAILCRDRALVVNLEHIKLIITPTQVLVLNSADAAVRAFVEELCRRLEAAPSRPFGTARGAPAAAAAAGDGEAEAPAAGKEGGGKGSRDGVNRPLSALNGGTAAAAAAAPAETAPAAPAAPGGAENDAADASKEPEKPFSETPFELRALEVALETVCAHLEVAAGDLEAAAHPALDYLTAAVTTPNLERVRRVKTRLVRLTTRVETLREVLEKILDDDSDMHDMNLTARALDVIERAQQQQLLQAQQQQQPEPSSPFSAEQQQQQPLLQRSSSQLPAQAAVAPAALVEALEEERERDDTEIAQVEQVLEPYFMQVDNTFNRLQTLCEYIDDTEDYINIELDNHRNQLIRLELMLTAATFAVSLVGAISGIFGMNLVNGNEGSHAVFVVTSVGSSIGAIVVFGGIFAVCKKRGLI